MRIRSRRTRSKRSWCVPRTWWYARRGSCSGRSYRFVSAYSPSPLYDRQMSTAAKTTCTNDMYVRARCSIAARNASMCAASSALGASRRVVAAASSSLSLSLSLSSDALSLRPSDSLSCDERALRDMATRCRSHGRRASSRGGERRAPSRYSVSRRPTRSSSCTRTGCRCSSQRSMIAMPPLGGRRSQCARRKRCPIIGCPAGGVCGVSMSGKYALGCTLRACRSWIARQCIDVPLTSARRANDVPRSVRCTCRRSCASTRCHSMASARARTRSARCCERSRAEACER